MINIVRDVDLPGGGNGSGARGGCPRHTLREEREMRKLLLAALTVLALGAFAAGPAFADPGGVPNSNSDGAKGDANSHGANAKNAGGVTASGGSNGTDTDPDAAKGNDS